MVTPQISRKTAVPSITSHIKEKESLKFKTMLVLLGANVTFVVIAAIVGFPLSVILPVASVFVAVISFFAYRAFKYIRVLKNLDAKIKEQAEFYRSIHSL